MANLFTFKKTDRNNTFVSVVFLLSVYFLFVNTLFVYKYGIRQDFVPIVAVIAIYLLCACAALFFDFGKIKYVKVVYCAITILAILLMMFVVCKTDKYALAVDRWSAIDTGIRALLQGDYPYTITTHLNNQSSNFPGLFLIGLPFYLLGNVGFLQVFLFALLAFCLYHCFETHKALKFIVLLLLSPAFWWEVTVLSDLMSNITLVLVFILLMEKYLSTNKFKYPVPLGIILAVLLLTRGVVFIPIALYLAKDFYRLLWINKGKTAISFTITAVVLIASVLWNCPDIETLKSHNPLLSQTSHVPSFVYLIFFFSPLLLTFGIKNVCFDLFYYTVALMAIPALYTLISASITFGFYKTLVTSIMDISYLSMCFPFLIIPLSFFRSRLSEFTIRKC